MIFAADSYWLTNAHVPSCLLDFTPDLPSTREGLSLVHLKINQGQIEQVQEIFPDTSQLPHQDLKRRIILPCFVDAHTHLDKGHIWERSPNPDGTFTMALDTAIKDSQAYWQEEDLYRRMEFGLKCSYAQGTQAIRTHLDSYGNQADISWEVFVSLQKAWRQRIQLQAVTLVSLDYYQTPQGIALADKIAALGGVLGGVAWQNPNLQQQLDQVFTLAQDRGLDLDFHADENGEVGSICLEQIANTALRRNFSGSITCGHCCSLAMQPPEQVKKTLELVKQARIKIISLPMCNLYLQDRQKNRTPLWRGVTQVHEAKHHGIAMAFASDNCRDPFFGFGDHDMLEVFEQAVKIAHLDTPYANWIASVTTIPAKLMGLAGLGQIAPQTNADLIIFSARYFSELLSRSQHDRIVLRRGKSIDAVLPDYSELDDLVFLRQ